MNKVVLLLVGLVLLAIRAAHGQTNGPVVLWQRNYGGALNDILYSASPDATGGYILGGRSTSPPGGGKTAPHWGNYDYWVLRVAPNGDLLWDRSFGGAAWDELYVVRPTPDGGFLCAGSTDSATDGNKSSPAFGYRDGWIVKLDSAGNKLWERSFGGDKSDVVWSMIVTADGGSLLGGFSLSSTNGNKTSLNRGGDDYWVLRLDDQGNKLWEQTYGGVLDDRLYALAEVNGGFLLAGYSQSPLSGNKTSPGFGSSDFWAVRIDAQGNKIWEACFGGSSTDELYGLAAAADGGFLLGGYTLSGIDGNKTSPAYGSYDYWVVRINAQGQKLWEGSYGGYGAEGAFGAFGIDALPDGGFAFGSGTQGYTAGGNKTSTDFGGGDWWVVRLNSAGVKLWDYSFGSSAFESLYSLRLTSDHGTILGGSSYGGADGNKTAGTYGGADYWLVKLASDIPDLRLAAVVGQRLEDGRYHFWVRGETNRDYVTDCSLNLTQWTPIQTNRILTLPEEVQVPAGLSGTHRFYRVRLMP